MVRHLTSDRILDYFSPYIHFSPLPQPSHRAPSLAGRCVTFALRLLKVKLPHTSNIYYPQPARPISIYRQNINMPKIIEAVYENGVFKPLEKVDLKEGEKFRLVVRENVDSLRGKYGRRKIDMMKLRDEVHDRRNHFLDSSAFIAFFVNGIDVFRNLGNYRLVTSTNT